MNQYFRANIAFWVRVLVVNDIFGTSLASVGKIIKILGYQHKYLECCSLRHPEKQIHVSSSDSEACSVYKQKMSQ